MSHSAMSIAESASVKMPPGPQDRRGRAQLGDDRLDPQRILADRQRRQLLDRVRRLPVILPP